MSKPPRDPVAMQYLESLQHDAMLNFAPAFGSLDEAAQLAAGEDVIAMGIGQPGDTPESVRDRIRRQLEFVEPERWSRYEPSSHRLFLSLAEDLALRGMTSRGEEPPAITPAIGTLPTHQLNAMSIPVPDSNAHVVAFESGLFDFTSAWAKIVMACVMSHKSEPLSILFIDLTFSQVVLGTATFAYNNEIAVDPAVWKPALQNIKPVFDSFLLAHEYGHIMLGHLASDLAAGRAASYERELAADAYAFRLMLAAINEPMHVYVCVTSLLLGMVLFEWGDELCQHKEYASETHPPAEVRHAQIHQLAEELLPDDVKAEASHWGNVVTKECYRLWEPLKYPLSKAREFWPEPWDQNERAKKDASGKSLKKDAAFRQFVMLISEGLT